MTLLKTIAAAFAMFSAIPVPQFEWEEKNMRFMLLAFPLVGLAIGLADALWVKICLAAALPSQIRALGLCLMPALLSGGIHLDGGPDRDPAGAVPGTDRRDIRSHRRRSTGADDEPRLRQETLLHGTDHRHAVDDPAGTGRLCRQ